MNAKKLIQLIVAAMLFIAPIASTGKAVAWSKCPTYITVQWGDTLSGVAQLCGTSVDAIRAANPGLGWWLYAGQTLYIPNGYDEPSYPPTSGTYTVQWGDTLKKIAARGNTSIVAILAVNPQIYDPSLIYAGQVINLPAGVILQPPTPYPPTPYPRPTATPPPADSYSTLKIAYANGMYLRTAPGGQIIASALNKQTMYYKPSSIYVDKNWKVWVEVKLYPPVKGYYTGWLLVRDQFGTYFTDPPLGN